MTDRHKMEHVVDLKILASEFLSLVYNTFVATPASFVIDLLDILFRLPLAITNDVRNVNALHQPHKCKTCCPIENLTFRTPSLIPQRKIITEIDSQKRSYECTWKLKFSKSNSIETLGMFVSDVLTINGDDTDDGDIPAYYTELFEIRSILMTNDDYDNTLSTNRSIYLEIFPKSTKYIELLHNDDCVFEYDILLHHRIAESEFEYVDVHINSRTKLLTITSRNTSVTFRMLQPMLDIHRVLWTDYTEPVGEDLRINYTHNFI